MSSNSNQNIVLASQAAVLKFLFFVQTPIEMDRNDGLSAHLLRKRNTLKDNEMEL